MSRLGIGGFWRSLQQQVGELFGRPGEGEAPAGPVVEFVGDGDGVGLGHDTEIGALGNVSTGAAARTTAARARPRLYLDLQAAHYDRRGESVLRDNPRAELYLPKSVASSRAMPRFTFRISKGFGAVQS